MKKIEKLDFSEAHFLDHSLWECIRNPDGRGAGKYLRHGGWRIHIRYWWDFKGHPALHTKTICRIGWHRWSGRASNKHGAE